MATFDFRCYQAKSDSSLWHLELLHKGNMKKGKLNAQVLKNSLNKKKKTEIKKGIPIWTMLQEFTLTTR